MPPRKKAKVTAIGSVLLGGTLPSALTERLHDLSIWIRWEEIVGKELARCCRPLRLINKTLTLTVSSAPWMQQLTFMREDIRRAVNKAVAEERVETVVLRQGRLQAPIAVEGDLPKKTRPLSQERVAFIESQIDNNADGEVQEALRKLMQTHYRHSQES